MCDQQPFMAMINKLSAWSILIIAMNRWLIIHIWTMIIHTCMISHLFIAMKNWPRRHIVLIIAMKGCWSFMIRYIRRSVKSSSHTIPEKVRNSRPINMGFKGWGWLLWWSWVTFKPFRYKRFNWRAQTVNFSVLSRRRQELCAENP